MFLNHRSCFYCKPVQFHRRMSVIKNQLSPNLHKVQLLTLVVGHFGLQTLQVMGHFGLILFIQHDLISTSVKGLGQVLLTI